MANLVFRHGTMRSAKTLNLLAVAHNYRSQGKPVLLVKPAIDSRFSLPDIVSRAGLRARADLVLTKDEVLDVGALNTLSTSCILVDEAQFCTARTIDSFRWVSTHYNIPVFCYGLRTDFQCRLFEGAQRLFEIADVIEEIVTACEYCEEKACVNMRLVDGVATLAGPQVHLGGDELYVPVCFSCYWRHVGMPTETLQECLEATRSCEDTLRIKRFE